MERIQRLLVEDAIRLFEKEMTLLIPKVQMRLKDPSRSIRMAAYEALRPLDENVFGDIIPSELPTTAIVVDVLPDSPAYQAGLRWNDIIESIDGTQVDDYKNFCEIFPRFAGTTRVLRGGCWVELDIESFAGCRFDAASR